MKPIALFLGSSMDKTEEARLELLQYGNPVMWQNASQAPIQAMLDQELPDYVIGITGGMIRNYPVRAMQLQIKPIMSGFEYYRKCLLQLLELAESEELK